jgi:argonaute-like protein implicated in RNA metabolism and viral defense
MAKRPQTALVGLLVRMREPLRKKLEVAARKKGVSLNSELVGRLERSFQVDSVEEIFEAQRAEIKRWADRSRAIEKVIVDSTTSWAEIKERLAEWMPERFARPTTLSSTSSVETWSTTHERQHNPTRKK